MFGGFDLTTRASVVVRDMIIIQVRVQRAAMESNSRIKTKYTLNIISVYLTMKYIWKDIVP